MAKRVTGLRKRGDVWHIEKRLKGGGRLHESCGTGDYEEAVAYLKARLAGLEHEPNVHFFAEAAERYVRENIRGSDMTRQVQHLRQVMPYIGKLPLGQVHEGTLRPFIAARLADGINPQTINRTLCTVRSVLLLCFKLYRNRDGSPWLIAPPLMPFLPEVNKRKPYPLSWAEQRLLFSELPAHLGPAALFKVNTGTREREVVRLRWAWEIEVPELQASVFVIPGELVKNRRDRLIVLNSVARAVVDAQRGRHPEFVFTRVGKPMTRLHYEGWDAARTRAADRYPLLFNTEAPWGFRHVRVHDLKHTFGARLRAAGVSLEDRQDLLGHYSGRVTTHYSAPELSRLIEAAEAATVERKHTILRPRIVA